MTYTVHESFLTLQGEGRHVGRPAVFCRFAGCNLWTGREEDRASAVCTFCDTQFVGGTKYRTAGELATHLRGLWRGPDGRHMFVVLTGGEPLLQVDSALLGALHWAGFYVAVETNGTVVPLLDSIDWVCVSPKPAPLKVTRADELKLVYPQRERQPEEFEDFQAQVFSLQPMDGPDLERNTGLAIEYCLEHPKWRLSVQTHKIIGVR